LTAAAIAAAVLSCAYLNIFWTASKEYEKATRDLDYAEFWDPSEQQKLTPDRVKLVDSALSRCGKVLLLYPESKWADDALLMMGKCFLLKHEYAKALTKFHEIDMLYAGGDFAEEANYLQGYTKILDGRPGEAVPVLRELAGGAKDKLVREKAAYLVAKIAYDDGDCIKTISGFSEYLGRYPDGARVEQSRLALGECQVRLGMYREAIEDLQPLLDELDAQGVRALLRIGRAYRMLGETQSAVGAFEQLLLEAEEDTVRARAGIEQALTLLDEGRPEEAIETLVEADSLGNKKLSGEISYRIGIIYESHLGDFDEAITRYDESAKRKSEYSRIAANRAKALKDVDKYKQEIDQGTGDTAKARYLLAETYLFDLGHEERAIEEYKAIADSFPGSVYAARSMLALAEHPGSVSDSAAAEYYRAVIESFPNTPYANVARLALGIPAVDVVIEEPEPPAGTAGADTLGRGELPTPPDTLAARNDTLAAADSAGATVGPEGPPGTPSIPDSLRDRYKEYLRYTEPDSLRDERTGPEPPERSVEESAPDEPRDESSPDEPREEPAPGERPQPWPPEEESPEEEPAEQDSTGQGSENWEE